MALAGSIVHRIHQYLDFEFVWVAAQDPAAGGSMIYWHTMLRAGEYGRIAAIPGSPWSTVIDGHTFSGGTDITIAANSAKELASGSVFVKHDPFGEKTFDFSYSQYLNITYEGVYTGEITGSGTAVLDRLDPDIAPRVDKTRVYLGESLNITPMGPLGATYRLRYALGGEEGIIGEDLTGPVDWVVPEALGQQFPYTDKAILRILCDAYRDGYPIGRAREAAVTVLVPDTAVPTVEAFSWEDTSPAGALGYPVQNVSRLAWSADCAGAMGSRVVHCEAALDDRPLGLLTRAGEQEILVTVTDSRGRVGYYREPVSVAAYGAPEIRIYAHRCREDGTADDTGAWASIRVEGALTCLEGTQPRLTVTAGTETVLDAALSQYMEGKASGERLEGLVLEQVIPAAEDRSLALEGAVFDGLFSGSHAMALSTAYCAMDVLYGGRGVAFGTVATEQGFLCAMDARFTGRIILPDGSDLMERLGSLA